MKKPEGIIEKTLNLGIDIIGAGPTWLLEKTPVIGNSVQKNRETIRKNIGLIGAGIIGVNLLE